MEDQVLTKPEFDGKKSSISILQELAIQVESPPVYDLVEMSGLPHNSFFKVQVRFAGFLATGSGGKKQLAKHCAANEMLKILKVERPDLDFTFEEEKILEPNKIEIEGNPIGDLKALCATHETEEKYTLTKEFGPTHAKEFEITCSLGGVHTVGKGKTKKNAKKEAAAKMMEKLAGRPEDVHPLEWLSSNSMEVCEGGELLTNYLNLRLFNHPHLKLLLANHDFDVSVARQALKNISEEQNFSINALKVEESYGWQTTVYLELHFDRVVIISGHGIDKESAIDNAATEALRFLKRLFMPNEALII